MRQRAEQQDSSEPDFPIRSASKASAAVLVATTWPMNSSKYTPVTFLCFLTILRNPLEMRVKKKNNQKNKTNRDNATTENDEKESKAL